MLELLRCPDLPGELPAYCYIYIPNSKPSKLITKEKGNTIATEQNLESFVATRLEVQL
jgi:hypothetical protein